MEYRRLGQSGMKVSAISIGAWLTFGNTVDSGKTHRILDAAIDEGINFVDVADVYAIGKAEEVVGSWLKGRDRTKLVVSSKVFWPMSDDVNDRGLSRKHIMESVEKSLRRLNTDYLDIYFCHRYDPETPLEETVRAMDDLVRQGKILYWGTSVWESHQLENAVGLANQWNLYKPQVEQPRYNLLDRHIETSIMETASRNGMGIVVWSPLAQGMLTGKYNDGIPEGSRASISGWLEEFMTPEYLAKVKQLADLAAELNLSLAELSLAWVLSHREISSAITGATSVDHVTSNVKAVKAIPKITDEVNQEIARILG